MLAGSHGRENTLAQITRNFFWHTQSLPPIILTVRWFTILAIFTLTFFAVNRSSALIGVQYQMQLGNPSSATADTNNYKNYLIQRTVEALDYNDNRAQPNWASWNLTAADIGTNARSAFITDTNLPANFYRVVPNDYANSGYDRGHLCPSKDRTDTSTNNDLVFLMSNVLPQNSLNNSGVWLQFENYCRDLVQSTNNYELLIICGPNGYTSGLTVNTNGRIPIPDFVWKIVVVVPPGAGLATNRITATNRVIAVKIPNNNSATNNWQSYVTSANQIQVDTSLTFFTTLAPGIAATLRSKVDGQTNPPPNIFAFSPTNGVVGTTVVIIGTNFSGASAVAFSGINASFTLTASNQITATVPTNAQTGAISVTTASGTAISINNFNVIGSLFSYSGVLAGWDVSGQTNFGTSPLVPTTSAPFVSVVALTRGSGVKTSGSGATGGWGGTGFTNTSVASAIASNTFVTFSITVSNGYRMSLTNLNRFDTRRSNTGATNGVLQFQVGTAAFVDVTNFTYSNAANGFTNPPIDLTIYPSLQNVGAGTNVTFRIVNCNAGGSSGTWYVWDYAGSPASDLSVLGTVIQVPTNAPAATPTITAPSFNGSQFQFTVNGTPGSNYVVQATTNLTTPNWIPIMTNPAPFVFIQSNASLFSQRFYRGVAP